MYIVFRYSKQ